MFPPLLRLSRCQETSSKRIDLDEIGLIFYQLDQWIVSRPPRRRRFGGTNNAPLKDAFAGQKQKKRKKINACKFLSAVGDLEVVVFVMHEHLKNNTLNFISGQTYKGSCICFNFLDSKSNKVLTDVDNLRIQWSKQRP